MKVCLPQDSLQSLQQALLSAHSAENTHLTNLGNVSIKAQVMMDHESNMKQRIEVVEDGIIVPGPGYNDPEAHFNIGSNDFGTSQEGAHDKWKHTANRVITRVSGVCVLQHGVKQKFSI